MKPHQLLFLIILPGVSCKERETPATSAGISTTSPAQSQSPLPPDPTPIRLIYHITDADMRQRTLGTNPSDESDPFADFARDYPYPSQQLAKAGLPLPKGAIIARPGCHFVLTAPRSYHDQVAALLGVKGTTPPPPPPGTE